MTPRVVAVLARPSRTLPQSLVMAMLTDVVDLVAATANVEAAVAVAAGYDVAAHDLGWPGTDVITVSADPTVAQVLQAVETTGARSAAVVVGDVPDLPSLMIEKLFSAMTGPRGASVAVCPAVDGGIVAIAAMMPVSGWLRALSLHFDDVDAVRRLVGAAPLSELSTGPVWHRIRVADDLARLDPKPGGWDATRAYLEW